MSIGLTRIDHVNLTVPRAMEEACIAFYLDVLGLKQIEKPPELKARGGAWFEFPDRTQLHISLDDTAAPLSRRHVCMLTTNLDGARAHLAAHGLAIEDGGTAEGLTRFFVRDPAGNRLEIGSRAS